MTPIERARLWWAVQRYDFWLDVHDVRRRRRRDLARELRTNLEASAAVVGAGDAIAALGGVRALATAATADRERGPRWSAGVQVALAVVVVVVALQGVAALNYLAAIDDAGVAGTVEGGLFPFPGSHVSAEAGDGLAASWSFGWAPLALGLLALAFVARPWRALRRGGPAAAGDAR